jgi:hypothetical protein
MMFLEGNVNSGITGQFFVHTTIAAVQIFEFGNNTDTVYSSILIIFIEVVVYISKKLSPPSQSRM